MADDNQFVLGQLVSSVKQLSTEVAELREEVQSLRDKANTGKGLFYGALLATGGASAGIASLIAKVFP